MDVVSLVTDVAPLLIQVARGVIDKVFEPEAALDSVQARLSREALGALVGTVQRCCIDAGGSGPAWQEVRQQAEQLKRALEEAEEQIGEVERGAAEARASCFKRARGLVRKNSALAAKARAANAKLDDVARAASTLGNVVDKAKRDSAVAQVEFISGLEGEFTAKIAPIMDRLRAQKAAMGARYPEAGFLRPETRAQMLQDMRVLCEFWRRMQHTHKTGLIDDAWWLANRNWAGRAKEYRLLGEPLDIANWYYTGKHLDSGGYADGIVDEAADDNRRRPGRYVLFQRIEGVAFEGRAQESSLDKARRLSRALGTKKEFASLQTWQEWLAQ